MLFKSKFTLMDGHIHYCELIEELTKISKRFLKEKKKVILKTSYCLLAFHLIDVKRVFFYLIDSNRSQY